MNKVLSLFTKSLAFTAICAFGAIGTFAQDASRLTVSVNDSDAPQTIKSRDGRELKLVWNDEFNGEGLPDSKKWSYEVGYVRNNESQYYTNARIENVFQKDGVLTIRTLKEKYPIEGKPQNRGKKTADYTSAAIETLGQASWLYGRVEVRAKLPKGKGIWPAIWMMGDNIREVDWPRCGEIDVMEYVGHTPHTAYGTIHMHNAKSGHVSKGGNLVIDDLEDGYYVYALEWTADQLTILVDDQVVLEFKRAEEESKTPVWPFDKPQYLILNTAIGGAWGGEIAEGTCPAEFKIDYVRVYQ